MIDVTVINIVKVLFHIILFCYLMVGPYVPFRRFAEPELWGPVFRKFSKSLEFDLNFGQNLAFDRKQTKVLFKNLSF